MVDFDKEAVARQCAVNAHLAGLIAKADIPRAAEEYARYPLEDVIASLIETAALREQAVNGPRFPKIDTAFTAN